MRVENRKGCCASWIAAIVFVGGWGASALAMDEETVSTERSPIVLEPSDAAQPAVVRLNEGASGEEDPLQIGPFELIDQDGNPFSSERLEGHHWVASFIFTSCMGYCPNLVKELRFEVVDRVDDVEVRFVTISVDPDRDTPERMKKYAEVFGADPERWTFLTGEKATIEHLVQNRFRRAMSRMEGPDVPPGFEVAHSLDLIHVGPDGRVLGTYDSREAHEVVALRRVLNGEIETPEENRPVAEDAAGPDETRPDAAPFAPAPAARVVQGQPPIDPLLRLPEWAARLPTTNAMLNGLATLLLLLGLAAIKGGNVRLHKRMMLMAFATSIVFLASYLTYHWALKHYTGTHGRPFAGSGGVRLVYLTILVSHVVLAAMVPVLAIVTIRRGLREQWAAHRRIARVTFPIWLYVSVTGVIIYGMLYHWPG